MAMAGRSTGSLKTKTRREYLAQRIVSIVAGPLKAIAEVCTAGNDNVLAGNVRRGRRGKEKHNFGNFGSFTHPLYPTPAGKSV